MSELSKVSVVNRTYFNAIDELKVAQVPDPDKRLKKAESVGQI